MTLNVAYITADWAAPDQPGGAGWHRCVIPAQALNEHSAGTIHAAAFPGMCTREPDGRIYPVGWDRQPVHPPNSDTWHVLVLQRVMFHDTARRIHRARNAGQTIINDLDDWYWGLATTNIAWWSTHPRNNPNENRDHYRKALAAGDHITVTTPYLAERIANLRVPTTIIPNTIPAHLYTPQPVRDRPPVIGWVGATNYRSGDLETLRGVLPAFLERHNLTFHHGGHSEHAPHAATLTGINPQRVTTAPITSVDNYPTLWDGIDIAVIPLADRPFNRAKSWIKAGEAAAAGTPAICADIDPYRHWNASPLARRPRDWQRHLTQLLDPNARQTLRTRQQTAAANHTPAKRWTDWANLYTRLAR